MTILLRPSSRGDTRCKSVASGFGYLAFAGLAHEAAAKDGRPAALGPEAAALPRAGQAGHLPVHERRAVARRHVRLQAGAERAIGRRVDRRPRARRRKLLGSPFKFAQHGESGLWISELFPELAKHADDLCVVQQHAHRPAEPLAGVPADAHRQLPVRAPVARGLDALRPGHRERQPARLRHAQPAVGQRRRAELRQRLPPRHLPGHADRRQPDPRVLRQAAGQGRGAGAAAEEHREPATCRATCSGRSSTSSATSTATSSSATAITPRSKGRSSRSSSPSACRTRCPKVLDLRAEPESVLEAVRHRRGPADRPLRPAVPPGPPAGRGRGAVRRGHRPGRLGPPLPAQGRAGEELRRDRPADRRRCSPT